MKKIFKFLPIAVLAFVSAGCTEEINTPVEIPVADTFTATIESKDTKTSIDADNYTVWTEGDAVSVFNEENANHHYSLVDGENSNIGSFAAEAAAAQTKVAAIYPHNEENAYDGTKFTIQIPAVHSYIEGEISKSPMVGVFADGKVAFKNAGALIRVEAKNIPAGYNKAILTSADVNLSGEMTITKASSTLKAGAYNEANNSVAITWEAGEEVADKVFYFPVPVAKFAKLTVTLTNGTDSYLVKERENISTQRNTCYKMTSDAEEIFIETEADLFAFAERVAAGNTYNGQEVKLAADITMTKPWTPIGNSTDGITKSFRGTFDGQGHTITGLQVTAAQDAGFFGAKWDGDVKNVNFDGATISGNHYAGVVIGWADGNNYNSFFSIDGCTVTNSTVTLTPELIGEKYDNGDKAAGIVGYAYAINVTNNTVSETTITGYRDLGGIVGCATESGDKFSTITGNKVGENVRVVVDNSHNYKNYTTNASYNLDSYCGRASAQTVISGNTGTAEIDAPDFVYLVPNSNWEQGNARFATYFFGNGDIWKDMTDLDGDGIYEVEIPDGGYTTMIFCRMNPNHSDNRWNTDSDTDATKRVWNQTGDMPLDDTKPYCVIPELLWDGMTIWSEDTNLPFIKDGSYYLVPNSDWKSGSARFAAYFCNGSSSATWVDMKAVSGAPGYYEVALPSGQNHANIIFCRMNPNHSDNRWNTGSDTDATKRVWNQTDDLALNKGNVYEITGWDKSGNWHTIK
ncbi:MAG: hypothetical protein J5990_13175 [Bacteroidales bacterium]|nr:hypothetical protein [Bacteroidales bacterium]